MRTESRLATGILALALFVPAAHAEDDARAILKSMSEYLAKQQTFSVTFDTDIEVLRPICRSFSSRTQARSLSAARTRCTRLAPAASPMSR